MEESRWMRVAVAIWNHRISPVFDVSRKIMVLDIENRAVTAKDIQILSGDDPRYKATRLTELNVETLICGAISRPMAKRLTSEGIRLISFVAGDRRQVIDAFLEGRLPTPELAMPGLGGRSRQSPAVNKNLRGMEAFSAPKKFLDNCITTRGRKHGRGQR